MACRGVLEVPSAKEQCQLVLLRAYRIIWRHNRNVSSCPSNTLKTHCQPFPFLWPSTASTHGSLARHDHSIRGPPHPTHRHILHAQSRSHRPRRYTKGTRKADASDSKAADTTSTSHNRLSSFI